jgi:hypothetical protein
MRFEREYGDHVGQLERDELTVVTGFMARHRGIDRGLLVRIRVGSAVLSASTLSVELPAVRCKPRCRPHFERRSTTNLRTRLVSLPGEFALVLLECAGRAVLADGRHTHDHLGANLDRLSSSTEGCEVGSGEARLDRIELDRW